MDVTREVLTVVAQASYQVGWYAIARALSIRGVSLEENLITLLSQLVMQGFLTHEPFPSQSQRAYKITDRGREYLSTH